jgi:cytoskeleton protein RodZ
MQTTSTPEKSAAELTGTVGQILKRKRTERGFELVDAARETRIPLRHLDAIETDNYDKQPLYPYAVGFVRNYAKFLGLDADPLVRQFKSETTLLDPSLTATTPEPLDENRLPTRGLVMGSILAGVALLGVIGYFALRPAPQETDVGTGQASEATEPVDVAATPAPEPVLSDTASPPVGTPVTPPATADPALAAPATALSTPPVVVPATTAPAMISAAGISPVGVVIRANEDSWIKVSDGGPKSLKLGILKAGESYTVPNIPGVTLLTGNAGGLDIFVNGRAVPPIGSKGMTAKNVSLAMQAMQARLQPVVPQR